MLDLPPGRLAPCLKLILARSCPHDFGLGTIDDKADRKVKAITVSLQGKPKAVINPPVEEDFDSRWSRKLSSTMECSTREGTG